MFKKLIIASAVLAATTGIAAAAQGPYVGGSLGLDNNPSKITLGDTTLESGSRGLNGTAFGGYGVNVAPNVYLGGEVFGGYSNTNTKAISDNDGDTISLRKKYSYGASLIPGLMVGEHTMAYGRVGLVRSGFEYKISGVGSKSQAVTGGQLGAGIQTSLTPCLDLRTEYVYTRYRSINAFSTKIKPSSDQVNVGLVYNFG